MYCVYINSYCTLFTCAVTLLCDYWKFQSLTPSVRFEAYENVPCKIKTSTCSKVLLLLKSTTSHTHTHTHTQRSKVQTQDMGGQAGRLEQEICVGVVIHRAKTVRAACNMSM
jgi:hypothetical protein